MTTKTQSLPDLADAWACISSLLLTNNPTSKQASSSRRTRLLWTRHDYISPFSVPNYEYKCSDMRMHRIIRSFPSLTYVDLTFHFPSNSCLLLIPLGGTLYFISTRLPYGRRSLDFLVRIRCRSKDFTSQKHVTVFKRQLLHTISGITKKRRKANELDLWRLATRTVLHAACVYYVPYHVCWRCSRLSLIHQGPCLHHFILHLFFCPRAFSSADVKRWVA